jgi:aminomethyltransferase
MTPFAGWLMPLQFEGIIAEHTAVREHAGIFDVSHMGRVQTTGREAADQIRRITTYNVAQMEAGTAHYSLYCTEDGGIADDVFVYRLEAEDWLIVHNASQAGPDFERVRAAATTSAADITASTAMFAVQGPEARGIVATVFGAEMLSLAPHRCARLAWRGADVVVGRTGYTGEDGVECIASEKSARELWEALIGAGARPAGLGARDTLRTEAALPLYGQDIDRSTNPFEAGLNHAVTLDDGAPFTGREALMRLRQKPLRRKLSCIRVSGRGVPRPGHPVRTVDGARLLARCTSGVYSPTLRVGIALAYLPVEISEPGTAVAIEIRDRLTPAEVVPRPFYRRSH